MIDMGAFQERVTSAIASQERHGRCIVGRLQEQPAAVDVALQGVSDDAIELWASVVPAACEALRCGIRSTASATQGDGGGILPSHSTSRLRLEDIPGTLCSPTLGHAAPEFPRQCIGRAAMTGQRRRGRKQRDLMPSPIIRRDRPSVVVFIRSVRARGDVHE